MTVFVLSVAIIAVAMLAMAVGVIFSNRCLRGSCGGPELIGPDGQPMACPTCSNKKDKSASQNEAADT
jgi:hypothetical protein